MSLARKLNLKDGMKVRVLAKPRGVDLDDVVTTTSASADGVILFVRTRAEIDAKAAPFIDAARADRIAWIAYPKAGQLGTDLNRDIVWKHLQKDGIQGVRQIAIDDVWSALRFRPAA
jgi:phage-related baseplate assembly protein